MNKKFLKIFIPFILILSLYLPPSTADVGDFETYSSGSSWTSSKDWGSSSWSSRDSYSSSHLYDNNYTPSKIGYFIFVGICIIILILVRIWDKKNINSNTKNISHIYKTDIQNEEKIINQIQEVDEIFSPDEFTSWVRDLFVKMQYAWSDRNFETIRSFETKELFEQHSTQLQRYIDNGQINKIERVSVNWVIFYKFEQTGDKDVLTVLLNSKMIDYIIDEKDKSIIKGNNIDNKINNYKLTFVRKKGLKTKPTNTEIHENKCPNCGSPLEFTSSGKCPYCRSIITLGEHDWLLSNLEKFNG